MAERPAFAGYTAEDGNGGGNDKPQCLVIRRAKKAQTEGKKRLVGGKSGKRHCQPAQDAVSPVRAIRAEGEAVMPGEAHAKGNGKGDDVGGKRGNAAVFDGKGQYGKMHGGGGRANEKKETALRGGVGGFCAHFAKPLPLRARTPAASDKAW